MIGDRGLERSAAYDALEAHLNQPLYRGDFDPFSAKLTPDFARTVDAEVLLPDPLDLLAELDVANRPSRKPRGVRLAGLLLVVGRRGDRKLSADRLDPVLLAMLVDERHHHLGRRSSSAWAKYADALRRISLARRSRGPRARVLDPSLLLARHATPAESTSVCRTHFRSPGERSSRRFRASHRDPYVPVLEDHPHRSLPNLLGKPACSCHDSILSRNGASGKSGAVHLCCSTSGRTLKISRAWGGSSRATNRTVKAPPKTGQNAAPGEH